MKKTVLVLATTAALTFTPAIAASAQSSSPAVDTTTTSTTTDDGEESDKTGLFGLLGLLGLAGLLKRPQHDDHVRTSTATPSSARSSSDRH